MTEPLTPLPSRRTFPWRGLAIGAAVTVCVLATGALVLAGLRQKSSPEVINPDNLLPQTATWTASPIPTETPNYAGTVSAAEGIAAQAQADAQNSRLLAISAQETAAAVEVEAARIEYQRTEVWVTATAQSGIWTAQAYPTSIPLTGTAQAAYIDLNKASIDKQVRELAATVQAPTTAALLAVDDYARKYGARDASVDAALRIMLAVTGFMFGLGFLAWAVGKIIALYASRTGADARNGEEDTFSLPESRTGVLEPIIPLEQTGPGTWERREWEIPCAPENLHGFAVAVVGGDRRLGVNGPLARAGGWSKQGYAEFRNWLGVNGFTTPAIRGGGEVEVTPRGLDFLREVVDVGTPPSKYYFRVEVQDLPYTEREITERDTVGERGEEVEE